MELRISGFILAQLVSTGTTQAICDGSATPRRRCLPVPPSSASARLPSASASLLPLAPAGDAALLSESGARAAVRRRGSAGEADVLLRCECGREESGCRAASASSRGEKLTWCGVAAPEPGGARCSAEAGMAERVRRRERDEAWLSCERDGRREAGLDALPRLHYRVPPVPARRARRAARRPDASALHAPPSLALCGTMLMTRPGAHTCLLAQA
jgi:hypothetical protein